MKQFFITVFAMGFVVPAVAQTNPPIASSPPDPPSEAAPAKLPEPTSTTTPDNTRYLNDPALLSPCQTRVAAFNNKPCDIIFIGDSITYDWLGTGKAIWEKNFAPRHALNFGINGDKTQNVLWRLTNLEIQSLKPKVAVLMIGANNADNSPHEIADGIKQILANTQEVFPGVKIILVSIMPSERNRDKMAQVNSIIKSYADNSSVYFLDLAPLMPSQTTTTPDGKIDVNWKGLSADHLHPNATGYQIWATAMEPLLIKLLAGK